MIIYCTYGKRHDFVQIQSDDRGPAIGKQPSPCCCHFSRQKRTNHDARICFWVKHADRYGLNTHHKVKDVQYTLASVAISKLIITIYSMKAI